MVIIIIIIINLSLQLSYLRAHKTFIDTITKKRGLQRFYAQRETLNFEYLRFETDRHVLRGSKMNTRGLHMFNATVNE
jgi:hypothetical protein